MSMDAFNPGQFWGAQAVPLVLTEDELIHLLRLDEIGIKDPHRTIRYYREKGLLRAVQIGRAGRYLYDDVVDFLHKLREINPR